MASRRWLVVPVVVGLYAAVLAGCSGAGGEGGTLTSARPSTPVTSSSSSSASTSSGAVGDGRPAAARAHTQAGAEAFLRFFFDQLNVAWTKPDAHALDGLCRTGDKICDGFRQVAVDLTSSRWHYATTPLTLKSLAVKGGSEMQPRAEVVQVQNAGLIVNEVGKTQQKVEATTLHLAYYLEWKSGAWRVTKILRSLA